MHAKHPFEFLPKCFSNNYRAIFPPHDDVTKFHRLLKLLLSQFAFFISSHFSKSVAKAATLSKIFFPNARGLKLLVCKREYHSILQPSHLEWHKRPAFRSLHQNSIFETAALAALSSIQNSELSALLPKK